jgi:hypothetical protein
VRRPPCTESSKPTSIDYLLLETETDPTKRAMIKRLLAEEKDKLAKPEARKAY